MIYKILTCVLELSEKSGFRINAGYFVSVISNYIGLGFKGYVC